MAKQGIIDKPVVILRKKRPAAAISASPLVKKVKAPLQPQSSPPSVKVKQSQPPAQPVPAAPLASVSITESASRPTSEPTGRLEARRRRYEERQRFLQSPEFDQIATALTTRWPHLFRVTSETIRPLAVGIARDISTHLPDFPPKLVQLTVNQWKSDHRLLYWKAVMRGGPRYDLDGNPKGELTPEEQADAHQQRKAWYKRREERLRQRAEVAQESTENKQLHPD